MADEKELLAKLVLKVQADQASLKKASEEIQKSTQGAGGGGGKGSSFAKYVPTKEELDGLAKFQKAYDNAIKSGRKIEGLDSLGKLLETLKKGGNIDTDALVKTALKATPAIETLRDEMEKSEKAAQNFKKALGDSLPLFQKIGVAGGAAIGGVGLLINKYNQMAGLGESTSRQWALNSRQIEVSTSRLGRTAEKVLMPYMEKLADFSEKAAGYAENNPKVVEAGLGIAGGAVALGTAATAASMGVKTYKTLAPILGPVARGVGRGAPALLKTLFGGGAAAGQDALLAARLGAVAEGGTGATAGAAGGGAGLLGGLLSNPVLMGIPVGIMGYNALAKGLGWQSAGQIGGKALSLAGKVTGDVVGGVTGQKDLGNKWFMQLAQLTGQVDKLGNSAGAAANRLEGVNKQQVLPEEMKAYVMYQRQEVQAQREFNIQKQRQNRDFQRQQSYAEQDFNLQRSRASRDFSRQQLYAEQDFGIQRARSARNFQLQMQYEEEDYYRQRSINARNFQIQLSRGEEDYNRQRQRAQEDWKWGLWSLMRGGDVLGYIQAKHQYDVTQKRAAEDYGISKGRATEDFQLQQQDAEQQFQIQRARQIQQYAIQQADAEQDFQIQRTRQAQEYAVQQADASQDFAISRARQQQEFAIQQADQEEDYARQKAYRLQAFDDQLREITGFWTNMSDITKYFTSGMVNDYLQMAQQAQTGGDLVNPTGYGPQMGGGSAPVPATTAQPAAGQPAQNPGQGGVWGFISGLLGIPQHAQGGYTAGGLAYLHPGEYVLSQQATRAGERAVRGGLTQANVIGAMGVGTRKAEITIRMDGENWTPSLKQQVRAEFQSMFAEALS